MAEGVKVNREALGFWPREWTVPQMVRPANAQWMFYWSERQDGAAAIEVWHFAGKEEASHVVTIGKVPVNVTEKMIKLGGNEGQTKAP